MKSHESWLEGVPWEVKKYLEWKQRAQKNLEHDKEVARLLPQQLMMDLLDEATPA